MSPRFGQLFVVAALLVLSADRPLFAAEDQATAAIDRFLTDYASSFERGNPFLLHKYDPQLKIFKPLFYSSWFDYAQETKIQLNNVQIKLSNSEAGIYTVSMVKIQEDLQADGLFTRGIVGVTIDLEVEGGNVLVMSHRVFPPSGAGAEYRSNDPRTWGAEHSTVEVELFMGLAYLMEGDIKNADRRIGQAVSEMEGGALPDFLMGPSFFSAMVYYFDAMLDFKQGEFSSASDLVDKALVLHPNFAAALNLKAEILLAEGSYDAAVALWRQSLDLKSDQPEVREVLSLVSQAVDNRRGASRELLLSLLNLPPSQAAQMLAPAVKSRPRDTLLAATLAKAHMASRDPEKALDVLEGSKAIGKDLEITYLAARINLRSGQIQTALELFDRICRKDPSFRDSLVFLVLLHASMGNYQEAIATLVSAERITGETAIGHALLGRYNLLAGRFLEAVSHLEKATRDRLPSRLRAETALLMQQISRQGR